MSPKKRSSKSRNGHRWKLDPPGTAWPVQQVVVVKGTPLPRPRKDGSAVMAYGSCRRCSCGVYMRIVDSISQWPLQCRCGRFYTVQNWTWDQCLAALPPRNSIEDLRRRESLLPESMRRFTRKLNLKGLRLKTMPLPPITEWEK